MEDWISIERAKLCSERDQLKVQRQLECGLLVCQMSLVFFFSDELKHNTLSDLRLLYD